VETVGCSVPEGRLDGMDVEVKENCNIESAGMEEETDWKSLGQKLTAAGATLLKVIRPGNVVELYTETGFSKGIDLVKPPTFKCWERW